MFVMVERVARPRPGDEKTDFKVTPRRRRTLKVEIVAIFDLGQQDDVVRAQKLLLVRLRDVMIKIRVRRWGSD